MQKIDSVGDERAEILNKGHWGNPKINNSRKPPSPTTDGIKASDARGVGSIPGQETKIPHVCNGLPWWLRW